MKQAFEIREVEPGGPIELRGHAAVFDTPYMVGGRFEERIAKGAFRASLAAGADVSLLVNHEGLPLARTSSGTLELREDSEGLFFEAELDASDPDVMKIAPKLKRGDLSECSFAFKATDQIWNKAKTERTVRACSVDRGDVSIVTTGANRAATATLRGEDLTLEQRNQMAREIGDRVGGPYSPPASRASRRKDLSHSSAVEEMKLRKIKLEGRAVTLPPHNPAPRYDYQKVQDLGKEGLAYKKPGGTFAWPIVDKDDLRNAIHSIGRAPTIEVLAVKRWIILSAERLREKNLIPDGWWDEVNAASPHGIPG